MFETIIAAFIQSYLSRYININADQLSAELLRKQQITIENFTFNMATLNQDIQTKFKLPIKIESINIGKIQCSFVWTSLLFRSSSAALIIKIEDIYICISESENELSNRVIEEKNNQIKKRNQLDLIEQQLEKEFECFGEVKSSKWNVQNLFMSFFGKSQIEIMNIHISYKSSAFYTIGLTCDSIQISNETLSRQIFRIINTGFYVDMKNSLTHAYILSPISSIEIYLIHKHFQISQKEHRYEFECSLNELNMKFNNKQIRILIDSICFIQQSSLRYMLMLDPSRPRSNVSKQTAKAWWYYAILAVLRTQIDSNDLKINFWFDRALLLRRLHQLKIYKYLYRTYLDKKYGDYSNFSSQDELTMNDIEKEFHIEHLLIIRRSIFQTRINEQLNQMKEISGWYLNYAKWITSKIIELSIRIPNSMSTNALLNENNIKFQEQMNTFIAESIEDEDLSESCHNPPRFRFKFVVKSLQIDILSFNDILLFDFYLKNLSLMTEFRLHYHSILVSINLEDLSIHDRQETINKFSTIICSIYQHQDE